MLLINKPKYGWITQVDGKCCRYDERATVVIGKARLKLWFIDWHISIYAQTVVYTTRDTCGQWFQHEANAISSSYRRTSRHIYPRYAFGIYVYMVMYTRKSFANHICLISGWEFGTIANKHCGMLLIKNILFCYRGHFRHEFINIHRE